MKIIPLSEGAFTVDKTKAFVPFDHAKDQLNDRPAGSLLVEIQPFAIITSKDILLLDTGLGFLNKDGTLQLHQNLMNNGINPMDVTKVLLSHLHKDHSGGIAKKDNQLNQSFLSFPQATYHVHQKELELALEKDTASYKHQDFEILRSSDKVHLMDDKGTIDNYIRYEMTNAHSKFHTTFLIEENGEKIFFGGDVAPQLQQMRTRFIAKYDHDGRKAMELRQQWWEKGKTEGWIFLFYHDIRTPIAKP